MNTIFGNKMNDPHGDMAIAFITVKLPGKKNTIEERQTLYRTPDNRYFNYVERTITKKDPDSFVRKVDFIYKVVPIEKAEMENWYKKRFPNSEPNE